MHPHETEGWYAGPSLSHQRALLSQICLAVLSPSLLQCPENKRPHCFGDLTFNYSWFLDLGSFLTLTLKFQTRKRGNEGGREIGREGNRNKTMKEILNPENIVALKSKNLGPSSLSASIPFLAGPLEGQLEKAPDATLSGP